MSEGSKFYFLDGRDGWHEINETANQPEQDLTINKTGIRVVKIEKFQRFCLKCGKILPTKIKQNYAHNCEKPDFLL